MSPAPDAKRRILVACVPFSFPLLSEVLADMGEIVPAFSIAEARRELRAGVDLLLCAVQFDDSQMLDLLRDVAQDFPGTARLCCRTEETHLPQRALEAAVKAARNLGAAGFVDFVDLERGLGAEAARERFRDAVRRALASPRPGISGRADSSLDESR